jgi:hypothetical protein
VIVWNGQTMQAGGIERRVIRTTDDARRSAALYL